MKLECKDWDLNKSGEIEVRDDIFQGALRKDIVSRVIRWQMAKSRCGNHATKTLGDVSGTTRKPWAQKETGRARQGSLRAPHFRGGGVVFGPHVRDHSYKLNKKVRKMGLISCLSFRAKEGALLVLDTLEVPFSKTQAFVKWLKAADFKSVLFVSAAKEQESFRCIKNVPYCDVIPVCGLNVLDIVKHKHIICDAASIRLIEERLQ